MVGEYDELRKNVTKVLSPQEKPTDSQLTRAIILLSHRTKEAHTFWNIAHDSQLLGLNCFTAWKFCSLLHKLLRNGHVQALRDSLHHRQKLHDLARFWAQQPDHMGRCIAWYAQVLQRKLNFHETYDFYSGDMEMLWEPNWDTNMRFQLCLDIFDTLDDLLQLQHAVFDDIQIQKISANSTRAKCRLIPLTAVIEECADLYPKAVTAMTLLCLQMPPDDIVALKNRFSMIFAQLLKFYERSRKENSITKLINIPALPAIAPTFSAPVYPGDLPLPSAPSASEFDDW